MMMVAVLVFVSASMIGGTFSAMNVDGAAAGYSSLLTSPPSSSQERRRMLQRNGGLFARVSVPQVLGPYIIQRAPELPLGSDSDLVLLADLRGLLSLLQEYTISETTLDSRTREGVRKHLKSCLNWVFSSQGGLVAGLHDRSQMMAETWQEFVADMRAALKGETLKALLVEHKVEIPDFFKAVAVQMEDDVLGTVDVLLAARQLVVQAPQLQKQEQPQLPQPAAYEMRHQQPLGDPVRVGDGDLTVTWGIICLIVVAVYSLKLVYEALV